MTTEPYDVVGIGIGPFNLGLAALTAPIDDLSTVFLEQKPAFDWHPGMLLPGVTLQTPFLSDLVSLADPTSPLSFLNYLKESGRLYSFYLRESFFPLRSEFVDYCRWAAQRLPSLRFGHRVTEVVWDPNAEVYRVTAVATASGQRRHFAGRRLVLGTGTPPYLPESCRDLPGDAVHSGDYLAHRAALRDKPSVTVVGSGQSAAEIFYDLLGDRTDRRYDLTWVTRSPRFFPLEYTKLTLELTSPEYTDYFHGLPPDTRDGLLREQASLYKGINSDLINAIFDLLYEQRLRSPRPVRLLTNTAVTGAEHDAASGSYRLDLHQREQDRRSTLTTHGLVLATGYRYRLPDFLAPVTDRIRWDGQGRFDVARNYSVDVTRRGIFVQNAELHTHGFVAPDLGMAAYRNSYLIREITGREHYPIEKTIAFQQFGVPDAAG